MGWDAHHFPFLGPLQACSGNTAEGLLDLAVGSFLVEGLPWN